MIGYTRTPGSPTSPRSTVSYNDHSTSAHSQANDDALVLRQSGTRPRTLDEVRHQVAQEVAVRAITQAKVVDGVRTGVAFAFSTADDEDFLRIVADVISHQLALSNHIFAIATSSESGVGGETVLVICGSSDDYVQRALLLASSKFVGRILSSALEDRLWIAIIRDVGTSAYDQQALRDVVRKSAQKPFDPLLPPPGSKGIDEILEDARAKLQRISPMQAYEELHEAQVGAPTFLVDIRPAAQRKAEGIIGVEFDPRSDARLAIADRYDLRIIIFCQEGYTSSLAAYSLQQLGLLMATDIIGGYQAWKNARLPVEITTAGERPGRPEPRSLASQAGSLV
ncbi:hypothetical protein BDQ17DRAFT_1389227 [Cyathus striatus]|nr:hypothetical protein BDQ17DRAFT_1389227 [Cyathus striatus]